MSPTNVGKFWTHMTSGAVWNSSFARKLCYVLKELFCLKDCQCSRSYLIQYYVDLSPMPSSESSFSNVMILFGFLFSSGGIRSPHFKQWRTPLYRSLQRIRTTPDKELCLKSWGRMKRIFGNHSTNYMNNGASNK